MKNIFYFIVLLYVLQFPLFTTNAQNSFSWVYTLPSSFLTAYSALKTPDNCFLISGNCNDNPLPTSEGFIIKTDSLGRLLWSKSIGNGRFMTFPKMILTNDSCILIVGCNQFNTISNANFIFMKFNLNGDTIWSKEVDFNVSSGAIDVQQTSDNGFILTGGSNFGSSDLEIDVIKLDRNGNSDWSYIYSDSTAVLDASAIKETPDSGFIVIGANHSNGSEFLLKLTNTGIVSWMKTYFSWGVRRGDDIEIMPDGYLSLASMPSWGELIKTDFSGNVIWSKDYNLMHGYSFSHHLLKTHDNNIIIVGDTDIYGHLLKIDTSGNILFSKGWQLGISGVVETSDSGLLVFENGFGEILIFNTDSVGNGANCIENNMNITDFTHNINMDSLTLVTSAHGVFNPFLPNITIPIFTIDTLCNFNTSIDEKNNIKPQWDIYPNPGSGKFILSSMKSISASTHIDIFNSTGQIIFSSFIYSEENIIDISNHPQGIYLIKIISADGQFSYKFILLND